MGPTLILILAGLLACWTTLRLFGSERQRQVEELAARQRAAADAALRAIQAAQTPANPHVDAPRRRS